MTEPNQTLDRTAPLFSREALVRLIVATDH